MVETNTPTLDHSTENVEKAHTAGSCCGNCRAVNNHGGRNSYKRYKVITTILIRPLDNITQLARSSAADLGIWTMLQDWGWRHITADNVLLNVKCALFKGN